MRQNLFKALQDVCGFTALESDMDEICRAIDKDMEGVNNQLLDAFGDLREAAKRKDPQDALDTIMNIINDVLKHHGKH